MSSALLGCHFLESIQNGKRAVVVKVKDWEDKKKNDPNGDAR